MKHLFASLFCLCALSAPSWADTTLGLEEAIETAVSHNPKLKAEQARLGISDAELITAGTRLNPSLVSDNGIAEKTYRLGLSQTIEIGGKRKRRVELSKAQREVLLAQISTQLLDIRNDVRKAYVEAYNAQERQKTYQNILTTTQELVNIAQKRQQAGDISQLDVLQTEIVNINTNNDLQTNAISLQQAKDTLASLLNQPLEEDTKLLSPDSLANFSTLKSPSRTTLQAGVKQTAIDKAQLLEEAFKNRPEIRQAMQNIEVAKAQLSLAFANRIPNLSLAAGPDLVAESGQTELNVFVIGSVDIPLFNRQQGPIAEAKAKKAQYELELETVKNQIRLEVNRAYTTYVLNQERIQRYEEQLVPISTEVVGKSKRAFEEGKASILIPINAQQAFINTQLAYLQALSDYQNAVSDLERAVGAGL